jgi:hypothetical protein
LKPFIGSDQIKFKMIEKASKINSTSPILWRLANFQLKSTTISSTTPYDPNRPRLLTVLTLHYDEASTISFKVKSLLVLTYNKKVS